MFADQTILIINSSCISILVLLAVVLLLATRFRGESGYAAAIIVLPNAPVYLYNVSRMLGWHDFALFMFPINYSINLTLMPLLWLFTYRNFNPGVHFRPVQLLHFLPALICLIILLAMPVQQRMEAIVHEMTGEDTWVGDLNTILVSIQLLVYWPVIFHFLHRKKRAIRENVSDAEWLQKEWIPKFMVIFAVMFAFVMICYAIWPRTDTWLIQIINVVAMVCLVYNSIVYPAIIVRQQPEAAETGTAVSPTLSSQQMKEICDKVVDYLTTSRAYISPDFSLTILSTEVGIHQKNISTAINGYLHKNFFELVNGMRIEEAKRLLSGSGRKHYTVESIYADCGFRSRSTFFLAFKKVEGKPPAQWVKESTA
jgi:hypothetical protein